MAKLSAYGRELIGEIELLTKSFRYMSDGTILVNYGSGWKKFSKCNDPAEEYAKVNEAQKKQLENNPFAKAFRDSLLNHGLSKRFKIMFLLETFYNDPDGMFAENEDSYDYEKPRLSHFDCVELCKLYKAYKKLN